MPSSAVCTIAVSLPGSPVCSPVCCSLAVLSVSASGQGALRCSVSQQRAEGLLPQSAQNLQPRLRLGNSSLHFGSKQRTWMGQRITLLRVSICRSRSWNPTRSAARATPSCQCLDAQQLRCLLMRRVTISAQWLRRLLGRRAVPSSRFPQGRQLWQTAQLPPPAQKCIRQPCIPHSSLHSRRSPAEALEPLDGRLQAERKAAGAQLHRWPGSHPASHRAQVQAQSPQTPNLGCHLCNFASHDQHARPVQS